MSSSAETETPSAPEPPLDWYDFSGREVPPTAGEFVSPESELLGVAKRAAEDLRDARAAAEAAASDVREVVFNLAVHVGRLEQLVVRSEEPLVAQGLKTLYLQLRTLKNQMLQIITDHGIELRDPTGHPAAEVLDWVEVNAWLHRPEYDAEVVARTEECGVFFEGRAVRFARVHMGAPVEADQDTDNDSRGAGL